MNDVVQADAPPYEPPTIEDVPLRPDEQVVAGCKTSSGSAPGVNGLPSCGFCVTTSTS